MSFVRPGQIARITVKEGDRVKAGQVLIQQDDAAEQAQLAQLKAQADDDTQIRAAQATLDQSKVDLRKMDEAFKKKVATEMEVEHARLEVKIAELRLELAEFRHKQDRRSYEEAKLQVERMRLKSPIDGKVENVLQEVGESVDALEKVIRVVRIDPLWVDAPVPVPKAKRLRLARKAVVSFSQGGAESDGRVGKIIHIASVADPASDTLGVRIELPNPDNRQAGERVYVSFPEDRAETDRTTTVHARTAAPGKKE